MPDESSTSHTNLQHHYTAPERRAKSLLVAGLSVLIVVGIGATVIIAQRNHDPIPASILQANQTALYYPTAEPSGYKLDTSTIRQSGSVVLYDFKNPTNHTGIEVTQQPTPQNFDPSVMFSHNPYPSTVSPLGTVYDLSFKNQSRFMLVAQHSLIFISSTPKISNTTLQLIVNGLKSSS
jgi:hypothetical protein